MNPCCRCLRSQKLFLILWCPQAKLILKLNLFVPPLAFDARCGISAISLREYYYNPKQLYPMFIYELLCAQMFPTRIITEMWNVFPLPLHTVPAFFFWFSRSKQLITCNKTAHLSWHCFSHRSGSSSPRTRLMYY